MSKDEAAESAAALDKGPIPLDTLRHSAAHVMAEAVSKSGRMRSSVSGHPSPTASTTTSTYPGR